MPWRKIIGTLAFVGILGLFLLFSFQVFSYYRQISRGELDTAGLRFAATTASASQLTAFAASAPGSGDLASADDPAIGQADAPLTIVQFADFGCPYSREVSYAVRAIATKFPNDVRVIYRDFPLVSLHPGADIAAEAGGCANAQGKFWELHDVMYRHNGEFTEELVAEFAAEAGLDNGDFATCMRNRDFADEVAVDLADGVAAGVVGTPTFFFNGTKIEGSIPFGIFSDLVVAFAAR